MSQLFDKLKYELESEPLAMQEFDTGWYLAKPISKAWWWHRLKDAIRVFRKKSFAVHYYEDEP